MAIRIAINGFGRIGRNVLRIIQSRKDMEVVTINDLTSPEVLAHLLKYDSVHGRFEGKVRSGKNWISVNGHRAAITSESDPANLTHGDNKIDFVIEATGMLRTRAACTKHLEAGAQRVVLTVPPKDEVDAMVVLGVNHEVLKSTDRIISNASCTTNCLAPVAKVLDESFGLARGLISTVHAYTNDQRILDQPHKDLRRARAAAVNIIPTSTGAARAVGQVLPGLKGKLDGYAMRVPVKDGSVIDMVCELKQAADVEDINAAMKAAAKKPLKGILEYCEDPIVSSDIIGDPHSSIFDAKSTMVMGKMVKTLTWYDNEWGYSNRLVELVKFAHGRRTARRPAKQRAKRTAKQMAK